MWMSFLYKIEGLEGYYCAKCVDEITEEMRFFKVEEIDEDTFTKQAGSYESIFVSGSQRGKDRAVYAFVDETEDEFEIYLDEFAEEE